jgi:hypothetical protein
MIHKRGSGKCRLSDRPALTARPAASVPRAADASEYNPWADTCLPLIQQNFPNARVTYSFGWELWGRQTPDRNAAVDALFAAQGQ